MKNVKKIIEWHKQRHPEFEGDNTPTQTESTQCLIELSTKIIDVLEDKFGPVQVTYGFTNQKLLSYLKKNSPKDMGPELDQHASLELNTKGNRICKRDGAACDIYVVGYEDKMDEIADYICNNLNFDRLYFYGINRPVHISIGPENAKYVLYRKRNDNGVRINAKSRKGEKSFNFFKDIPDYH